MIRFERVISARLTEKEFKALWSLCKKLNLTRQDLLRAIVIDALVENGYDALRPDESEGCESCSETGEARGATAP